MKVSYLIITLGRIALNFNFRVELFGNAALRGDRFHPKLNIIRKPIAKKYCEGKVKRTLKRELKVREITKREANRIGSYSS